MFRRERSRSDVFALEIAKKHLSLLYKSSLHFTTVKEYEMTVFFAFRFWTKVYRAKATANPCPNVYHFGRVPETRCK